MPRDCAGGGDDAHGAPNYSRRVSQALLVVRANALVWVTQDQDLMSSNDDCICDCCCAWAACSACTVVLSCSLMSRVSPVICALTSCTSAHDHLHGPCTTCACRTCSDSESPLAQPFAPSCQQLRPQGWKTSGRAPGTEPRADQRSMGQRARCTRSKEAVGTRSP